MAGMASTSTMPSRKPFWCFSGLKAVGSPDSSALASRPGIGCTEMFTVPLLRLMAVAQLPAILKVPSIGSKMGKGKSDGDNGPDKPTR